MSDWLNTDDGRNLFEKVFEAAGLPEVEEKDLEPGTYTNLQLAEMARSPEKLLALLMKVPGNDPASKRSILSFAVEME